MPTFILRFTNILLAAILAGVSFGIWIGFNPADLSPSAYVEQQQNMLRSLKVLMISLVVVATLLTAWSAFLQRGNKPVFVALLVAAGFFLACILITGIGIKPIDDAVMTWTAGSPPDNWTEMRDQWWSLHILRTIAELIALCLVVWVSVKRD